MGQVRIVAKEEYLRISTMCGYGSISPFKVEKRVEKLVRDIKKGRVTVGETGRKLTEACVYGVFNLVRLPN